jgi:hypothetical protein
MCNSLVNFFINLVKIRVGGSNRLSVVSYQTLLPVQMIIYSSVNNYI